jgi:hypothetical protein
MMDKSNVDTVIIGGTIKKRAGKLVGVNEEKLLKDVELAQERVLARIQGPAVVGAIPDGNHSAPGYTPSLLGSCCLAEEPYPDATPLRRVWCFPPGCRSPERHPGSFRP